MSFAHSGGWPVAPFPRLRRYLDGFEAARILRAALFGVVIGAGSVGASDLLDGIRNQFVPSGPVSSTAVTVPVLPPLAVEERRAAEPVGPRELLNQREQMRFSMQAGGVLLARGSISADSAERFASELEARGGRVKTVSLDSPGGSLENAMRMARLIRDRGLATTVADGALCASSCPLILAGGVERSVGRKASIGLHQFYAAADAGTAPAQAMADAQITTARISRLLTGFGVDPALWLHALDTPPRSLYYLSAEEIAKYGLATTTDRLALREAETRAN